MREKNEVTLHDTAQTGMTRRAESSLCSFVIGLLHKSIVRARTMLEFAHHDSHQSHSCATCVHHTNTQRT